VTAAGEIRGKITDGLLVYVGVDADDDEADVRYLADKVRHLRIFPDERQRMNRDVVQAGGQVLVVSAFTVSADARKGRRPSFDTAAPPERAEEMYERVCTTLEQRGCSVARGRFRTMMDVHSVNAGPVCILLDSRRRF
jgi:D-tyrosyl-tRNA(Tyr) deacylase